MLGEIDQNVLLRLLNAIILSIAGGLIFVFFIPIFLEALFYDLPVLVVFGVIPMMWVALVQNWLGVVIFMTFGFLFGLMHEHFVFNKVRQLTAALRDTTEKHRGINWRRGLLFSIWFIFLIFSVIFFASLLMSSSSYEGMCWAGDGSEYRSACSFWQYYSFNRALDFVIPWKGGGGDFSELNFQIARLRVLILVLAIPFLIGAIRDFARRILKKG